MFFQETAVESILLGNNFFHSSHTVPFTSFIAQLVLVSACSLSSSPLISSSYLFISPYLHVRCIFLRSPSLVFPHGLHKTSQLKVHIYWTPGRLDLTLIAGASQEPRMSRPVVIRPVSLIRPRRPLDDLLRNMEWRPPPPPVLAPGASAPGAPAPLPPPPPNGPSGPGLAFSAFPTSAVP